MCLSVYVLSLRLCTSLDLFLLSHLVSSRLVSSPLFVTTLNLQREEEPLFALNSDLAYYFSPRTTCGLKPAKSERDHYCLSESLQSYNA